MFHERQTSKDCAVHSLNNAMGWEVISPEEVSGEIDKRVEIYTKALGTKRGKAYRDSLSEDNTFFSAEAVWYASAALGRTGIPKPIEYKDIDTYKDRHMILLGIVPDGSRHAVGVRQGLIFDSLNDGPAVPLTDENIKKIYKEVLGVFVF